MVILDRDATRLARSAIRCQPRAAGSPQRPPLQLDSTPPLALYRREGTMEDDHEAKRGFFETCRDALLEPRAFFSRPMTERSRWGPVAFAMAVTAIALPIATLLLRVF